MSENYSVKIKKIYETDVLVCGLGPAGLPAAITAARSGASVMGIDKAGFAGGNFTAASVNSVCGFSNMLTGEIIAGGLSYDICARAGAMVRAISPTRAYIPFPIDRHMYTADVAYITTDIEKFKRVSDLLMVEAGVQILYHTRIFDVIADEGKIRYVIIANKDGISAVKAKMFIDCTGDGDVAFWAGAPMEIAGKDCFPTTTWFIGGNLMLDASMSEGRQIAKMEPCRAIERAYVRGELNYYGLPHPVTLDWTRKTMLGFNNTKIPWVNPVDAKSLSDGEIEGRAQARCFMDIYRRDIPEFKESELILTGPMIGTRDSRRIIGEYVLTEDDIREGKAFDDTIGLGGWPLDAPGKKAGVDNWNPADIFIAPYEIPYRSLLPKKIKNLLVAGRCHSVSHFGLGSTRGQVTCMIMGEAAGYASAMALDGSVTPKDIDVKKLQSTLLAGGTKLKWPRN